MARSRLGHAAAVSHLRALFGHAALSERSAILGTLVRDETNDDERNHGYTGKDTQANRQDLK